MLFANRLTKTNIWVKFNESHSKGLGDMEWDELKGKLHDPDL